MKVEQILDSARESLTVRRIYGDPFEKDGLTIIPAASVQGGAGGGSGREEKGQEGEGGGFAMVGRPVGVYIIKGDHITWRPAVDPNRLFAIVGMVVIAYVLSRPRVLRARAMSGQRSERLVRSPQRLVWIERRFGH
jgi:uncharacterized spore protein YtfJ